MIPPGYYQGIEIAPYTLATYVTDIPAEQRQKIRKDAARAGVTITGVEIAGAPVVTFEVTNQDGELIALFRGKSVTVKGHLVEVR